MTAAAETPAAQAPGTPPPPVKVNPITELVKLFATNYHLIHSEGRPYAIPRHDLPPVALELAGTPSIAQPFGAELRRKIVRFAAAASLGTISRAAADTVLLHLEARAHEGPETRLSLRFHHDHRQGLVCIDLARADGHAVTITPEGWWVGPPPVGVVFRRSHATKPLPDPVAGGSLTELADLLALDPDSTTFRGLLGWMLGLPFAASVRPGVLLFGPYGCGKSTRVRLATSILEPSPPEALGSAFGRNFGDDQVRALHRAVPLYDNLSAVSWTTSDELCCLVTGTARETRSLYSDGELSTFPIRRPLGLTAVGVPAGLRPDALDRLVVLEVPPITERVEDAEIQAAFDEAHPRLLGAVCTAVAGALAWWDKIYPPTQFRMAAYARVLTAVDESMYDAGRSLDLLGAYTELTRQTKQRTAAEDTFGAAVLALLEARGGQWQGKASELIQAAAMYQMGGLGEPGWPSTPRKVPEVLAHLREGLTALGVSWTTTTVRGSTRYSFTLSEIGGAS